MWVLNQSLNEFFEEEKIPDFLEYETPLLEQELKNAYKSFQLQQRRIFIRVTLPIATQLTVEAISVKRRHESHASLSLRVSKNCTDERFRSKIFWSSIDDANNIVANVF